MYINKLHTTRYFHWLLWAICYKAPNKKLYYGVMGTWP